MAHSQAKKFRSLAARFVFGSIAPALAILALFGLHLASTAFAYVIAIVAAPLMGSFSAERYLSLAGFDWFSLRRSSNSGLQLFGVVAGCPADLIDAGPEQPGGRRRLITLSATSRRMIESDLPQRSLKPATVSHDAMAALALALAIIAAELMTRLWAWASRPAVRSWKLTGDNCQLPAMRGAVRRSNSSCQKDME
jgi:hypothetical protein